MQSSNPQPATSPPPPVVLTPDKDSPAAAQAPTVPKAEQPPAVPEVKAEPEVAAQPEPAAAVVGQRGSVVTPDRSGRVAAVVSAAPPGSLIVVRSAEFRDQVESLLRGSGKHCDVSVQTGIGPEALWRRQRSPVPRY